TALRRDGRHSSHTIVASSRVHSPGGQGSPGSAGPARRSEFLSPPPPGGDSDLTSRLVVASPVAGGTCGQELCREGHSASRLTSATPHTTSASPCTPVRRSVAQELYAAMAVLAPCGAGQRRPTIMGRS